MTIQEFINWMLNAKTTAAYLCMGMTAMLVLAILCEMLSGFKRCAPRQILHTLIAVVCVAAAFMVTEKLITSIHTFFEGYSISELLKMIEDKVPSLNIGDNMYAVLDGMDERAEELILTLPAATLLAPVIFTVLYAIFNLICKIPFWIFSKFIPKIDNLTSRIVGLMVGAAEGLFITAILFLPFVALTDAFDYAVETVDESDEAGAMIVEFYDDSIGPMGDTPIFNLTRAVGGDKMMDEFCIVDLGDGEIDLRPELQNTAKILMSMISMKDVNWSSPSEQNKDSITNMIEAINSSDYYCEIFSGIFKTMGNLIDNPAEDEGELLSALTEDMLSIFKISSKETVAEDLYTFRDLYFILADENVLSSFDNGSDAMLDALTAKNEDGDTVINRLTEVLKRNERTAPILTTLTKLSVSIMAENMGLGEDAEQLYEDIKTGVNDILAINPEDYSDPDEYTEAIGDTIESTLEERGIALEREVIDEMAKAAQDICESTDLEELTDEQISDILLKYYDGVLAIPTP